MRNMDMTDYYADKETKCMSNLRGIRKVNLCKLRN